ncbi:hypothetical protein D1AOALGA4SA_8932 [Olavius algarvensis Delta 1 endosymbiont]|nr:hypothetical protein D1AOALGA4SA_8932 [Olavius algarvensis Delta 1 endosymbiont]
MNIEYLWSASTRLSSSQAGGSIFGQLLPFLRCLCIVILFTAKTLRTLRVCIFCFPLRGRKAKISIPSEFESIQKT